jgi:hypothetical protein
LADKNFEVRKGLTVANTVIVTSGANVGIGNTSPTHTLSINGNGYISSSLQVVGSISVANLTTTTNTVTIGTSAYFTTTGSLGLGTNAPSFRLHVKGSGSPQYYVSEDGIGYSLFGMDGSGGAVIGAFTTGVPLAFYSNGSLRATLSANGNLGVGTASPTTTLDVSGSVSIAKANVQSQTLTDASTISWNTALGQIATVTLGGNRTFGAPTNLKIGTYVLNIVQDGVGGRTGDFTNAIFKFPGGVDPVLTTTASARDIIFFYSDGTNLYGSFLPDVK